MINTLHFLFILFEPDMVPEKKLCIRCVKRKPHFLVKIQHFIAYGWVNIFEFFSVCSNLQFLSVSSETVSEISWENGKNFVIISKNSLVART